MIIGCKKFKSDWCLYFSHLNNKYKRHEFIPENITITGIMQTNSKLTFIKVKSISKKYRAIRTRKQNIENMTDSKHPKIVIWNDSSKFFPTNIACSYLPVEKIDSITITEVKTDRAPKCSGKYNRAIIGVKRIRTIWPNTEPIDKIVTFFKKSVWKTDINFFFNINFLKYFLSLF